MRREHFHYDLPDELIARQPARERRGSRLLVLDGASGELSHRQFPDLCELVRPGDLMVFNDTRVIPARLFGQKASGGKVEMLVERLIGEHELLAHLRASKSPKPGGRIDFEGGVQALIHKLRGKSALLGELSIGIDLYGQQVRDVHSAWQFAEILTNALFLCIGVGHEFVPSNKYCLLVSCGVRILFSGPFLKGCDDGLPATCF